MRIDIGEQGSLSEILDWEPSCHKMVAWCDLRFASHICDTCFHVVFGPVFFLLHRVFEFVLFCTALFRHDPIRFASPCLGVCSLPLLVFPICTAALMRLEGNLLFSHARSSCFSFLCYCALAGFLHSVRFCSASAKDTHKSLFFSARDIFPLVVIFVVVVVGDPRMSALQRNKHKKME